MGHPFGRCGYRWVTARLRVDGFRVTHKRVKRRRRAGLRVPVRQMEWRRLWLADGSCVRLRPAHASHVWSDHPVEARTTDGRAVRLLIVIDEYTRECLAIDVARRITADNVRHRRCDRSAGGGPPRPLRSDNGAGVRRPSRPKGGWAVGIRTLDIGRAARGERVRGSFDVKVRDELLNPERFDPLREAQVRTERWRGL